MANMHLMYCHEYNLTFRIESLTPEDTWNAMKANEKERVPVWDQESKTVKPLPLQSLVENRNLYLERGWCMAEVEWSSLRRVNAQHQRIDKPKAGENSDKSEKDQDLNGKIPMTPERFKAAMKKSKFTHRSDEDSVIHLQEKIYVEKVTACEELILEGLPGTEVAALAATLPDFKNLKIMKAPLIICNWNAHVNDHDICFFVLEPRRHLSYKWFRCRYECCVDLTSKWTDHSWRIPECIVGPLCMFEHFGAFPLQLQVVVGF